MREETFKVLNNLDNKVRESFEKLYKSKEFIELSSLFIEASNKMPDSHDICLDVGINAYSYENNYIKALNIGSVGIMYCKDSNEARLHTNLIETEKFVDNEGNIFEILEGACPVCWCQWEDKRENNECPHCDIKLGVDIKILLENNKNNCPVCGCGEITKNNKCTKCLQEIDMNIHTIK